MEDIKKKILEAGRVTSDIKKKYFYGFDFGTIRNQLEKMGLDRHMPMEIESTEIAVITPFGIMMQIRHFDNNQLSMWGGGLNDDEKPIDGAIRELKEETGIEVDESQLQFIEVDEHFHEYANSDKVYFKAYRYCVRFEEIPKITTDEESVGAFMVVHTILDHQQDFIKRMLGEK